MSDALRDEVEQLGGVVLAHTALITALFGTLQNRRLIDQNTINEVIDAALTGVENASPVAPSAQRHARLVLERTSRNMGGPIRR